MVCQMAVFVRVTVAFWVLPKSGQRDVMVHTLTSKGGPWIPIALPNAYTLSHILFCCLYVHQVLDMYDSHSFRSESQDIRPGYFWQWLISLLPPLHILFLSHYYAAFSFFLKGRYFRPSRIQIYVWLHLSKQLCIGSFLIFDYYYILLFCLSVCSSLLNSLKATTFRELQQ